MENTQICKLHNCDMKKRSNANGIWYSHQLADKSWCSGYDKTQTTKKFTQLPNGQVHEEEAIWGDGGPYSDPVRPQNGPTSEVEPKSDIRAILNEINFKLDNISKRLANESRNDINDHN